MVFCILEEQYSPPPLRQSKDNRTCLLWSRSSGERLDSLSFLANRQLKAAACLMLLAQRWSLYKDRLYFRESRVVSCIRDNLLSLLMRPPPQKQLRSMIVHAIVSTACWFTFFSYGYMGATPAIAGKVASTSCGDLNMRWRVWIWIMSILCRSINKLGVIIASRWMRNIRLIVNEDESMSMLMSLQEENHERIRQPVMPLLPW